MEKLTQSLETYLLAIDNLLQEKKTIIVKDVANYLKIGGASTADAIKKLKEKGYINYKPYENITLTSIGEEAILLKKYRHNTIKHFLNKVLDIEQNDAEENANAIEYSMTKDVFIKLVNYMDFMEQCSCAEPKWQKSCKSYLQNGKLSEKCSTCTGSCCCGK